MSHNKDRSQNSPAPGGLLGAGLIRNSQGIILTHTKNALSKKAHWVSIQVIIYVPANANFFVYNSNVMKLCGKLAQNITKTLGFTHFLIETP